MTTNGELAPRRLPLEIDGRLAPGRACRTNLYGLGRVCYLALRVPWTFVCSNLLVVRLPPAWLGSCR